MPIFFAYFTILNQNVLRESLAPRRVRKSSAGLDFFRKKLLTYKKHFAILSLVAREKIKNPEEMRYAEVSELADEQD